MRRPVSLLLLALAGPALADQPPPIPAHPDQLKFGEIAFEPPKAAAHRVVLGNGMVVYIAEDRALPLVNVSLTLRAGKWLEPAGKEGLAALVGSQMRRGGTSRLTAEQLAQHQVRRQPHQTLQLERRLKISIRNKGLPHADRQGIHSLLAYRTQHRMNGGGDGKPPPATLRRPKRQHNNHQPRQ